MLLSDVQLNNLRPVLPYSTRQVRVDDEGTSIISWGVSSYGYDIRLAPDKFLVYENRGDTLVDPKQSDPEHLAQAKVHKATGAWIIPANSYGLGYSLEYFELPRNVTGICLGKSTYARSGVIVNMTPLEAGWRGNLTIEVSNASPTPCLIYPGEGIAQVLFFKGESPPITSYADRQGKYQDQTGITLPRI